MLRRLTKNVYCWKTCGIKFFHPNQLPSLKKRAFHSRERTVIRENPFALSHPRRHHLSTLSTLFALFWVIRGNNFTYWLAIAGSLCTVLQWCVAVAVTRLEGCCYPGLASPASCLLDNAGLWYRGGGTQPQVSRLFRFDFLCFVNVLLF